jgi:hypothetical protein
MPVPNTSNLTIGEFYAIHSSNENAAIYVDIVPSVWKQLAVAAKRKGGFMALELYVDMESVSYISIYSVLAQILHSGLRAPQYSTMTTSRCH